MVLQAPSPPTVSTSLKHPLALGPLAYPLSGGEEFSPFIQEMWGVGQAAGRQSRVAASPSSSTWSLSLMWKTGGKSGREDKDSHGSAGTPARWPRREAGA